MSVSSKDGVSAMDIPSDAVAVVGMACKFPGAETLDEYWSILDAGESMLKDPPNNHLPTHDHPRSTEKSVFHSNFLKDNSSFDNRFFKKSSREAASMDPQQRLLLEVSYQALESSGFFGPREPDLDVGCYIGVCASDYNDNVASHPPNAFSALGTLRAFAPGRVSHFFGLRGPSIALDTACSSSAVAIDAACKAILHGDCRSAIAGGVSVFSSPFFYQNLAAASFLSPTGASKSFDARADGYCRGEGVGLVVLKRLADAISDGDTVLGTILATSVRQSSNKVPITVPYSSSQTELYRKLLDSAGIVAEDVTFVEAHGTGTPVGDPLEYEAIKEVFAKKPRQEPLYFASVKGNIGHTEGASGVAGLIKTILMMQNRSIPRQANFVSPHPKISLVPGRIAIPTATIPWTADRMIACVNNYGAAGSIAAMLVSEPPRKSVKQIHGSQVARFHEKVQYPLLITGNSPKSLGDNCASVRDYALSMSSKVGSSENIIADLTFNLSDRQNRALPYMFTTTISNLSELDGQLRTAAFNPNSSLYQNNLKPNPTILVFGGQIGRSVNLSKQVFESSGLLQKYLDQCDGILKGLGSRGIYPDIFENKQADDVVMLQTMQFSLQYACAQSWIACGLNVDCIVGHSFGQLVALTVSGVLSLADGLKFVHGRAVLMRERWGSEKGSMVAIEADRADIEALVASVRGVEVACFNGPRSQVLVGSSSDISDVVATMTKSSMSAKAKILDVTHGFHSRFCDPILPELERLAQGLTFNQPRIHLETCSGNGTWPIATSKLLADHTRSPVYFEDAVKRIEQRFGSCTWLEAGSNTLVTNMARRALDDQKEKMSSHVFFPINLSRDGALGALAETTTNLWKQGHHVQYWPFHHQNGGSYQVMNLPPYQFEKAQHWLDFDFPSAAAPETVHDKLDASRVESVKSEPEPEPELISFAGFGDADAGHEGHKRAVFIIDPRVEEWKALVSGHSVLEEPLCPAPLYIELVLQAAKHLAAIQNISSVPFSRVEDLEMPSPLGMSQDKIIQLVFTPTDHTGRKYTFSFHAQPRHANSRKEALLSIPKGATTHASGKVEILLTNDNTVTSEFERTRKLLERMRPNQNDVGDASSQAVSGPLVYKLFSSVVQYHDFYQCVRSLNSTGDGSVLAHVSQPQSGPSCIQSLLSMPLAIDNFFQVPGIYANCLAPCPSSEVFVSTHVDRIQISPDFANVRAEENGQGWDVFAMSTALNDKEITNDIFVTEKATGKLIFIAFGARFTRVRIAALAKILSRANSGEVAPSTAAKLPPKARVEFVQAAPTVPQVQRAVPVVSSGTTQHTATPVPQQQPKQHPSTNGSVSLAPPVSIISAPSAVIPKKSRVEGDLREMISKMTDVPADEIKDDVLLIDLGVDSLMATEVLSDIQKIFNISISPDLLQELQTFASLRSYLDGQMSEPDSDNHLPVAVPWQTPAAPAVSPNATLAPGIVSREAELDDRTEKSSVEYESSIRDSDQEQDLTARLADLLSTHLEVPVDELVSSPNLVDLGLDSLLCMELMSDIDKDLGVSIDLSDLTGDVNFGHLVDKLVGELRTTKTTTSSTPKSTNTFSSGVSTPLTSSQSGSDDEGDVMPTKTQAPRISMNGPLANAADAFESIKGDYDEQARHYKFIDFYTSVYGKQSELVLAYVVEAFLDLGVDLKTLGAGDRIPAISTVPKHGRMIDVFHRILHQAKVADYNGEVYFRSEVPINLAHSSVLSRQIIAEFPQHAKEHMLLELCGPNLAKFLSGTMDPLAVLFGNKANRTIVEDVYAEAPMFVIMSQLLTSFLEKTLSTSTPGPNGKFKIVELGAGTGATTRCVVDRLVQRGIPIEYTFTDISPSLVLGSKRKFTKFDCMKFGTIDIEKEPPAEYLGQFDIVLATNCIHATSSLPNSLANINKLLRPHGFVSLVELTTRNFWLDLVFGLLDGWWLYDDNRPYVLATPEFWDHTMRDKGFQHVSWTGGHSRESEAVRVITGFKQPVQDPSSYKSTPQGVNGGTETVVFKHTDKNLPLRADVYYPSASQATVHKTWVPGLLVHGGGHVMLSRQDLRPRQIQLLLDNGVLPVAVDYRLCPETTILEGPLVDVNDAYVWLRKALPSLKLMQTDINKKLDSTRAVVIGWSTGGTLAMSLSWTSLPRGISPPDAILAFYCPTDYQDEFWTKPNIPEHSDAFGKEKYNVIEGVFPSPITAYNVPPTTGSAAGWIAPKDKRSRVVLHMNWYGQTLPVLFKGLPSASAVAAHDAAQFNHLEQPPVEDIIKASPYAQIIRGNYRSPTHVIFGTGDDLIPWKQAQRTVDAMRDSGIDCGLTLAPDQPHLFDMYRDSDGSRWGYVMEGYNFLFSKIGRGAV